MQTIPTPVREPSPAMTAALGCQHSFAGSGPHYCSYIQPQSLLANLYPAQTADEQLVISFLAACVLWWHLQHRDLAAVDQMLAAGQPFALEQTLLAQQRLERCIQLAQTMEAASTLVTRAILAQAQIGFRVQSDIRSHPLVSDLALLTAHLQHRAQRLPGEGATATLRSRLREYEETSQRVRLSVLRLCAHLNDPARPVLSLDRLLPLNLLAWAEDTLRRHHPETLIDAGKTHPLVFIVAHQLFEVWFPATTSALAAASQCLIQEPPQVLAAAALIRRAADMVHLWQRMIHLPQSMSAADYIAFRAELRGGSGTESIQFREVELLAGLRHARYRQSLEQMSLMTPDLERRWHSTSLNDAILSVLVARGVFLPEMPPAHQAEQLAAIWLPTAMTNPQADVAALCQAALDLDEQFWLWRQHHIAMVKAMIGGKPSIGAGGVQNHELLMHDQEAQPVGGLPYLHQTTSYRLFPVISQALEYLQENWQAVATATRC